LLLNHNVNRIYIGDCRIPYNEALAKRVCAILQTHTDFKPQKMMGGVVYMVNGNMCCGVTGDALLIRVGADARDDALTKPHTRPMQLGGRSPKGFIFVDEKGCSSKQSLTQWVNVALNFVSSLQPKK